MNDAKTYWKKQTSAPKEDLKWNFPEQKQGRIVVIGGNSQNFSAPIKTAEFLAANFPLKQVQTVLPDALEPKFPPAIRSAAGNLTFTKSTPSGSFDKSKELNAAVNAADFALFIGDLSKNSTTCVAIADALAAPSAPEAAAPEAPTPAILTRDTIDLLNPEMTDLIERKNLIIIASLLQLQKLFRAIYYPRVLLLSQPLMPIIETLHKFTLSYENLTLLTFHDGKIIVGNRGKIVTIPIENTTYSPISLWSGTLASKVAAYNLWNPQKPLDATVSAVFA